MLTSQMLLDMMLAPFEDAIRSIVGFLGAQQIDVYLFDDDRLLINELKTDGRGFTYNKQPEDTPDLPEAVHFPTFQKGQETICEIPLMVEGRLIGHYRICRQIKDDFDHDKWLHDIASITPVAARIIESNHNRLQAQKVYIDDLTQIYNRRKLNEQMGRLFNHFKTGQKKVFVAMIDIDKFKVLNDMHGHPVGDEVLKQLALLFREGMPSAYRYGSEIFCAVFYGHEKQIVIEAMEALRKRVETTPFTISGLELHITISAGIAELDTGMNAFMDVIDLADQALYVSKEDGRNRCTCYDDVKGRLAANNSRLRQKNARLEEEVEQLRQEVASKKTAVSKKAMSFKQYKRFEHIRRLCDDYNIEGVIKYDGTGLSVEEMVRCLFEEGYIAAPTVEAMLDELEMSIETDVNNRPVPEALYVSEWVFNLILADPKGFPIPEKTVLNFQGNIMSWAITNGLDVRTIDGESWIPEDIEC